MLIARAPVRISFAGGGTDLRAYYARHGGMVISTTINKYIYGIVSKNHDTSFQVISADYQSVFNMPHDSQVISEVELKLPQMVYANFDVQAPVNVFLASEVPPGTGLGSSSTLTVLLSLTFSTLASRPLSRLELAERAYQIETEQMGASIGKQDPYAAAYGGLSCITFEDHEVRVTPLRLPVQMLRALERRVMLFYTGRTRQANEILQAQSAALARSEAPVIEALHHIKDLAHDTLAALESGDLDAFGEILDASWRYKKRLAASVSNSAIDDIYAAARQHGAQGGKITGAGGGGFLMLCCPEERQADVRAALERRGLCQIRYAFEFEGARVLMHTDALIPTLDWRSNSEDKRWASTV